MKELPENQTLAKQINNTYLAFTVVMFGVITTYTRVYNEVYYKKSAESISPLTSDFNESYFEKLLVGLKPQFSVKMLLAAEQRIPGLGERSLAGYTVQHQS